MLFEGRCNTEAFQIRSVSYRCNYKLAPLSKIIKSIPILQSNGRTNDIATKWNKNRTRGNVVSKWSIGSINHNTNFTNQYKNGTMWKSHTHTPTKNSPHNQNNQFKFDVSFNANSLFFSSDLYKWRIYGIFEIDFSAPKPCTKCIQLDGIMQHLKIKLDKVRTQLSVKSAAMARMQEQLDRYNAMFTKDITKSLECQFCLEKLSKEEYSQHSCGTGRAAIDCEYCSQCFPTTERLLHHLEYFHDDKTFYECDRCPKVFAMKDLMDIHISCHPAVDPQYQCEICDKNFFKPSDLNRHIDSSHLYLRNALHQKPRKFARRTFPLQIERWRTFLSIYYFSAFQCGTCGERFDRADIMETHITQEHIEGAERRNGDYRLFECYVCKLRFVSMAGVRKHLSQHDLSQSCSVCNQMLSMEMFERHLCDSKSRELPCEYCNSIFSSVSELMNHLDVAHINGRKIYKCLECPKFFPMKLLKSFHKHPTKKVSNEQSFTCDICSKSFLAITSLIQHKKIHDPENSAYAIVFIVEIQFWFCFYFATFSDHICDKCGKGFRILGNLEKHFKIHTEPKFKCSDCPRKFHRKTAYNLHRDAAHRNAKYVCEYCDAELSSYTGLHHHTSMFDSIFLYFFRNSHSVNYRKWMKQWILRKIIMIISERMHKRTDDDRHFQCTSCPKKFFENNVLRHHMKTVHSTIKRNI